MCSRAYTTPVNYYKQKFARDGVRFEEIHSLIGWSVTKKREPPFDQRNVLSQILAGLEGSGMVLEAVGRRRAILEEETCPPNHTVTLFSVAKFDGWSLVPAWGTT